MKLDPVRQTRQVALGDAWRANNKCGTLECATGFGKTICALLIILVERGLKPDLKILIVVPTLYLQQQWVERLLAFNIDNVDVMVINSVVKGRWDYDFMILDEIHQYTAEIFGQVFDRVSYTMLLGLTATLDHEDLRMQRILIEAPVVGEVTMQECMENGWIAPFQVYNYGIRLNPEDQLVYTAISSKFSRAFSVFGHDFKLAMKCATNKQEAERYAKILNWDAGAVLGSGQKWLGAMRQRKEFLYANESKHVAAHEVVKLHPDRRIITFSQTIASAENIATKIGRSAEVYHSGIKGKIINGKKLSAPKTKQYIIDRFSSNHHWNTCNVLCTAKAMDQGADLPDIDMAIVLSASSKTLQAVQRYGRSLRAKEGKRTVIVEIYVMDTQDERWLRDRQRELPSGVVKRVHQVEEIV